MQALVAVAEGQSGKQAENSLGLRRNKVGKLLTDVRVKMALPAGESKALTRIAVQLHAGCQIPFDAHF